jgi:hypothetical protein
MGTIPISDYLASRPEATTPVGATDRLLVMQGGAVKQIASGDVGAGLVEVVLINSAVTPTTTLPASGEIIYEKSDTGAGVCSFIVLIPGQTMCQELTNGLSGYGEVIRVKLIGSHWYKIG